MFDEAKISLVIMGFFVVFIAVVAGAMLWLQSQRCAAAYSNYQAEWGYFSGCRILWEGKMTPVEIIREI